MMRHSLLLPATCLFSIIAIAESDAPEPVTDRPDQTESSITIDPGRVQIETGTTYTKDGDDSESLSFPETLVRIGVHERVELRVGFDGWTREFEDEEESGFGDAELGAKFYLWPERGLRPETALLVSASVPIGENDFSTERVDPSFRFLFSHTVSERVAIGYNLGVAWETEKEVEERPLLSFLGGEVTGTVSEALAASFESGLGASPAAPFIASRLADEITAPLGERLMFNDSDRDTMSSFEYTVASGFAITDRLGAFIEVFGAIPMSASGGPAHSLDGGFTYLIRPNMQFDIAGGVGLTDDAEDWFVGAGFSVRLPN